MTVATALMFGVAQIIEGEAICTYCNAAATLTTWNGADPEPEAVCAKHAIAFLDATRQVVCLFPIEPDSRDASSPLSETAA